jgi:mannose-1-phosphate guanylyltransferase
MRSTDVNTAPRVNADSAGHDWAIVLAGGDGTRLRSLTEDGAGNIVPKQFCSLSGGHSLLAQTLARAGTLVERERITAVVSATHAPYWQPSLRALPRGNVFVQPVNRGTAIGILLPVLRILQRDAHARVLILPSDHYVHDEAVLAESMRTALEEICHHRCGVVMLGIEAEHADPELGYIVPGRSPDADSLLLDVHRFVEKPLAEEALRLRARGALWNSFILACRARSLVELYRSRWAEVVDALRDVAPEDHEGLSRTYGAIPEIDFSRHVAAGREHHLGVLPVARCGWNDLGTPQRLADTLTRYRQALARGNAAGHVNLAERLARARHGGAATPAFG